MNDLDAKTLIIEAKEYYDMRHELCEYRMLENELGIDLITLFKALQNGIYDKRRYYQGSCLSLSNGNLGLYINDLDRLFLFKDYGKTWSVVKDDLTKEELL